MVDRSEGAVHDQTGPIYDTLGTRHTRTGRRQVLNSTESSTKRYRGHEMPWATDGNGTESRADYCACPAFASCSRLRPANPINSSCNSNHTV
jgi:hypothetical protein